MSTPAESVAVEAMADKIERLERQLKIMQSAPDLPSQLGDFARILRSHGIATVFHAGLIEPINGGSPAESLRTAIDQFARREHLTSENAARIFDEIYGSLFDASSGLHAVSKAKAI
jgi:hypothetical protein